MIKQKKLLLRCADDSVIIMSFVLDDGHDVKRKGTKEEIEAEIKKSSSTYPQERLPIIDWQEIKDEDMPLERTYRNAWVTKQGKTIEHDMLKAKEIHRNILRAQRQPLFEKLDVEYQRADEIKDDNKKQEVILEKQRLRDITDHPDIEKAKTVEDLKKITILTK